MYAIDTIREEEVYLVHRIDGEHNEHVHDVVRVEAAVHCTGEPFLGDVHGADYAAAQGHCVLKYTYVKFALEKGS